MLSIKICVEVNQTERNKPQWFLRFWDKVNVSYSRGQQAINSVSGEGMAGEFMWTNQVAGAMLVVVRQREVSGQLVEWRGSQLGGKEDWKRKDNDGHLPFLLPISLPPPVPLGYFTVSTS